MPTVSRDFSNFVFLSLCPTTTIIIIVVIIIIIVIIIIMMTLQGQQGSDSVCRSQRSPRMRQRGRAWKKICHLLSSCLWRISQTYKNIYLNNFSSKSSIKGCLPLINIKEESGFNAILCLPTPKLLPKCTREAAKRDRFYIWQYLGWLDSSKILAGFRARF